MKDDAALRIARAIVDNATARMKTEPGFKMTMTPLADALRPLLAAEFPDAKLNPKPRAVNRWKGAVDDAQWLDELEKDAALRFIDVRRELGKCQLWMRGVGEAGQKVTRQRFINWLLKAQPTIGYDAQGKSSSDTRKPKSNAPKDWIAKLNRIFPISVYAKGGAFAVTQETDYAWSQLPAGVRASIERDGQ
jgi:hypothetical protein